MFAQSGWCGAFGRAACGAAPGLVLVAWMACLLPAGAVADVKQYRFTNRDTTKTATDLHLEFWEAPPGGGGKWKDKPVSWPGVGTPPQDPADTFKDAKGNGTSHPRFAKGETGKGVPPGKDVVIDFNFEGDAPNAWRHQWTFDNKLSLSKAGIFGNPGYSTTLLPEWSGAAAGDGILIVSIPGEPPVQFATTAGDPPQATAQKFAQFVEAIPFGEVLAVNFESVFCTSRSYDPSQDNIAIQVIQQDSTQPLALKKFGSYGTSFETPPINGAPLGVPIHGQDGWYTVNDPGSEPGMVHTFQGNPPNFQPVPGGTDQFLVTAQGGLPARAQRDSDFSFFDIVTFSYDSASKFIGAVPVGGLTDFMSSFSLQPSTTARFFIQINVWQDKVGGSTWSAGYLVAPEPPGSPVNQTVAGIKFPGPEWMNIPADEWKTFETTISFSQNRILRVAIIDPQTEERIEHWPEDWYLDGGSAPTKPLPTSVRFFSGNNLGNHTAWDYFTMGPAVLDEPCYPDCDGNGQLNIDDFICFQLAFALQDPYADCDGNQVFNIDDFICFQLAFALGCEQ